MGLRDIGSLLPPGFRFYPTDEELVCHYLCKRVANEEVDMDTLMEINLHSCEPWQLPDGAKLNSSEWYFFSFRDRKYATGFRTNRATTTGYWKATGKDRLIWSPTTNAVVGMRKTLVFYQNRAPNGIKTGWIMHEFRLENPYTPPKEDWVLCRVFHKGKGENNNQLLSHQNEFENSKSPCLVGFPSTDQTFSCKFDHQANPTFSHSPPYQSQISNTVQGSSLKDQNFLQLSTPRIDRTVMETNPAHDCEYDLLFNMDFEEINVGDIGVPINLGELVGYGDDNSLVLI